VPADWNRAEIWVTSTSEADAVVSGVLRKISRVARFGLAAFGAAIALLGVWLMAGQSTGIEKFVVESAAPRRASAIICITGGIGPHNLPTPEGWERVYTAVQLLAANYAPLVVFSGGGTERVSEAEIYAEAARWLGSQPEAVLLDPIPGGTADHPRNLLKLDRGVIRQDTPLLVVTSRLHSKRTAMCFRKAGFTNFSVVTSFEAVTSPVARSRRQSSIPAFKPSGKDYGDPLNRLRWGLDDLLVSLRELVAIGVYRYRGDA